MANQFSRRHIGITERDLPKMLETIGVKSVDELIEQTIPANIRLPKPLDLPEAMTEQEFLTHIHELAQKNQLADNYIGLGYYGAITPAVILRNVFENPVWYTSYTPYQAEISQGRLEALLNFQTMVADLTALPLANCSLLDEATAAAEAMTMMMALRSRDQQKAGVNTLFVDRNIFPQTLDVLKTRSLPQGVNLLVGDYATFDFSTPIFGAILQYPASDGRICDYRDFTARCHENGAKVAVAADIMSLVLLAAPGEWGADIAFGTTQRFGMPLYFGGPSAAYFATTEENKRHIPGRLVGISKDANGKPALRLALQSREQHIKREKALSNICTAQALPAIMSGFYAAYHGNDGLTDIAYNIHAKAIILANELKNMGCEQLNDFFFDTIRVKLPEGKSAMMLREVAEANLVNFRYFEDGVIGISTDELTSAEGVLKVLAIFAKVLELPVPSTILDVKETALPQELVRQSRALNHEIFEKYHSETEMMRYIKSLDRKDISLTQSMISLGSCTMKLNAAAELLPLSWQEFTGIHPFAPEAQVQGYKELIANLEGYLSTITGFAGCTLQPNSGAAGEYTGLLTIHRYQQAQGQGHRNVVLIPASAHGTNPASSAKAGLKVVVVKSTDKGEIDVADLKAKAEQYKDNLACLMVTYPSTHGVFEESILDIINIIHENGGLVYMDGANMNAQVGLTSPGFMGADVCHLNLHKTFAMPHGGGGPGVGPIGVCAKLVDFLPNHSQVKVGGEKGSAMSASPFGSAMLLPITYGYLKMLGGNGLADATRYAILNANYLKARLAPYYKILYTGTNGMCAHEMILDCNEYSLKVSVGEIAKRLMDYGFHAPTVAFPVHNTLMVEPTESEPLSELDRLCEAFIAIREEIRDIMEGKVEQNNNLIVNAPHTMQVVCASEWNRPYTREQAAFPQAHDDKYWPTISRIDDAYGDRNLQAVWPME